MIRRTLPWFGVVAALLLLAPPVHADGIEPDPYAEEGAEPEIAAESGPDLASVVFDVVPIRFPLYFSRLVLGLPFFVFYPLTLGSGYNEDAIALLWTEPFEATFLRPLGESPGEY